MGKAIDVELNTYKHMAGVSTASKHPGRNAVRTLLDSFIVTGPDGEHQCLVHPPLWENIRTFLGRNSVGRLPTPVLGIVLQRLFQALDFMHSECRLVHTDIKADNIMFRIEDDSVFVDFERQELENPSPRKEVDGRFIYLSRQLGVPKGLGPPVLCDFGAAVSGESENDADIQPNLYRAPEVILGIPWSYKVDIWNAGCMVWDILEGRHMFSGRDPEHKAYRSRAHLASIISVLGTPPPALLTRGKSSSKFFTNGKFSAGIEIPREISLEEMETNLEGKDKQLFMQLMMKMMQWEPEQRSSAKELLQDPWLQEQL